MKRPPVVGDGLLRSVPATMAYFQLCRALRRNLRVKSDRQWLVVVHCHHERDIRPVSKACRFFLLGNQLSRQMNYFGDEQAVLSLDDVSNWKDKSGQIVLPRNAKDHMNLFMVCGPSDTLSADLVLAADAIIRLGPSEESHLVTALRLSERGRPGPNDVSALLRHDLQTLQNAFRRDRTIREALASLSSIPKVPDVAKDKKSDRTLDQIHGMGEAGEWGRRLAADLAAWKQGALAWNDIDSGILLSGPPGTGKTSFATALAVSCGVHLITGSYASWQASGHLGDMLASMKKAFNDAMKNAPAILFIDEIDAIGHRRPPVHHNFEYNNKVISALLEHLDGAVSREGVVVVGACNNPEHLDSALIRGGRLETHVRIPLQDRDARVAILHDLFHGSVGKEDLTSIAGRTDGWTGADLTTLARKAKRKARQESRSVVLEDIVSCLPPLITIDREERFRAAIHEAGHALTSLALGYASVRSVTLKSTRKSSPEAQVAGETEYEDPCSVLVTRTSGLRRLAVLMGGAAAEDLIFGERSEFFSSGPRSDLQMALRIAAMMVGRLALGSGLPITVSAIQDPHKDGVDDRTRDGIERLIGEAYALARDTLSGKVAVIRSLASELTERGELGSDAILRHVNRKCLSS